jgi:alpha-glucosidase
MSTLPILIDTRKGVKILFSETDVNDYPCMFVKGRGEANGVTSIFPPAPLETTNGENIRVSKEASYIARTAGTRSFPWRWFIVAKRDGQVIESTMPAKLAPACAIKDVSWIKPGLVMWDYLSRDCDFGPEVNYRVGLHNAALKHYIDFASRNKIPYYCIDAGWAKDGDYPIETIEGVDLPEIVRYAKEKNVDIMLWLLFSAVQRDFDNDSYDLFDHFEKIGVKGFKIDFMDRSDQAITNFYERAARTAAEHRMVVELHGSFTPRGLEYKYPNILSYEGVLGTEWGAGTCTPDNSVYLPFIRNVAGPMSFTPGIMFTVQPEHLHGGIGYIYVMIGTRAHHMAYYILFESGLQMISDSPRMFDQNPDCRDFIFATPVTWDETHALAADAGQYAVVARRHGDKWWIGGISNGVEKTREFDLDLSFLPSGKTFRMTAFEDGPNSTFQAMDYNIRTQELKNGDKLHIKLVRNGGFAAVLE